MSSPAPLKAPRRFVTLLDGVTRELSYDIEALLCRESHFEIPRNQRISSLRNQFRAELRMERAQEIFNAPEKEREALIDSLVDQGFEDWLDKREERGLNLAGLADQIAWAYCLTASWREDNNERMSFSQFKKIVPIPVRDTAESQVFLAAVLETLISVHQKDSSSANESAELVDSAAEKSGAPGGKPEGGGDKSG